jgi:hypothetical protein
VHHSQTDLWNAGTQDDKTYNLFTLAYSAGRSGSLNSFHDLCQAAEMLRFSVDVTSEEGGGESGTVKYLPEFELGDRYRIVLACRGMLACISDVIRERDHERIRKSLVFGSARDEATDIATKSSFILYVKFVESGLVTLFLGLQDLKRGDAASIFEVDEARLAEIWEGDRAEMHKRQFTWSADGCSAMFRQQQVSNC